MREEGRGRGLRARAYLVHFYTATGGVLALAAAMEIAARDPSPKRVFFWLLAAVLVDATDGPLARRFEVKGWAPGIDGRTIDDIVDYLTFTFLPLLLVWRMEWVPEPAMAWLAPAALASLFGFANREAKDEAGGFFLGFPSYWNIAAFYAGLGVQFYGAWVNAVLLLVLSALAVAPVGFLYPNLAPRPWRGWVLGGAVLWGALLPGMLSVYPEVPGWVVLLSLLYPAFYTALSLVLWRRGKRGRREAAPPVEESLDAEIP